VPDDEWLAMTEAEREQLMLETVTQMQNEVSGTSYEVIEEPGTP